jgi:hypothetical protein
VIGLPRAPLTGLVSPASSTLHQLLFATHLAGTNRMTGTFLAMVALIAATAASAMLQTAAAQDVEKGQRSFNK